MEGGMPTYAQVQAVFNHSCTVSLSCHMSRGSGIVDLTNGNSYAAIVGVNSSEVATMPYVTPGDTENSFLFRKIDGSFTSIPYCMAHASTGECGVRMPMVGGAPLTPGQIALIRDWINAGAPND
jgi:hypothetical protein